MVKLALLLCHPGHEAGIDPALRAQLAALGIAVTACGRASVSAQMADDDFARLFGPPPATRSGLLASVQEAPALPVPPALQDSISLITIAARPSAMQPPT